MDDKHKELTEKAQTTTDQLIEDGIKGVVLAIFSDDGIAMSINATIEEMMAMVLALFDKVPQLEQLVALQRVQGMLQDQALKQKKNSDILTDADLAKLKGQLP